MHSEVIVSSQCGESSRQAVNLSSRGRETPLGGPPISDREMSRYKVVYTVGQ